MDGATYTVTKYVQLITNCSCSHCRPQKLPPLSNDVTATNDYPISELIYEFFPEKHKSSLTKEKPTNNDFYDQTKYSEVSNFLFFLIF